MFLALYHEFVQFLLTTIFSFIPTLLRKRKKTEIRGPPGPSDFCTYSIRQLQRLLLKIVILSGQHVEEHSITESTYFCACLNALASLLADRFFTNCCIYMLSYGSNGPINVPFIIPTQRFNTKLGLTD